MSVPERDIKPVMVAVCGGSCSGKSWLAESLRGRFATGASVISMDRFYKDFSHLPIARREGINFDDPEALDWGFLLQVLRGLTSGSRVELPYYDFASHSRTVDSEICEPRPVVIVEGLWLLMRTEMRTLFDFKLFIDCDEPLQRSRRLDRDRQERARSVESIERQLNEHVMPMHRIHVAPQKVLADFVVQAPVKMEDVAAILGSISGIVDARLSWKQAMGNRG